MIGEEANAPEIVVPNSSGGDGIGTDGIGRERNCGEGKGKGFTKFVTAGKG